jgi:hypothetical protein
LTQLIWDFGATNNAINRARQNFTKQNLERDLQRINLVLSGIDAHIKLLKAQQQLAYAKQSEDNVQRQTQLENLRTQIGKGYTTDYLQAQAQLAGAQAKRVGAEGALNVAKNRYQAVFGDAVPPEVLDWLNQPPSVPRSEDEVLKLVMINNPDVLVANARAELKVAEKEAIEKIKEELIKKHGETDETGNISIPMYINVVTDEEGEIVSREINPKFVEFQNDFNTLLQEERELEYHAFKLEEFENVETDGNYNTFFKLIKVGE